MKKIKCHFCGEEMEAKEKKRNYHICKPENKGIICPKCGVIKFEQEDIENIEENGECMICDKLRGEQFDNFQTDEELLDNIL